MILGRDPAVIAVGGLDEHGVITQISSEIETLVGFHPYQMAGRQLLDDEQHRLVMAVLNAEDARGSGATISVHFPMQDAAARWRSMRALFSTASGPAGTLFVLVEDPRDDESADRLARLERLLWRIAAEVDASGILERIGSSPNPTRIPLRAELTKRQWDVLSRLLRGDRVPAIAAELYVSESTVRNHLAGIFERFDVHSQSELLALLRRR
jgi:DNA-binding CsgD family transcriptional regulator